MESEKYQRDALLTLDILKKNIETLDRELQYLILNRDEHLRAIETIKNLKDLKNEELLVSIGANIFIFCKASEKKESLISIGSDVVVQQDFEKSLIALDERLKNLEKLQEQLEKDLINTQNQYESLYARLEEYAKK